jgi:hypothetical protein
MGGDEPAGAGASQAGGHQAAAGAAGEVDGRELGPVHGPARQVGARSWGHLRAKGRVPRPRGPWLWVVVMLKRQPVGHSQREVQCG